MTRNPRRLLNACSPAFVAGLYLMICGGVHASAARELEQQPVEELDEIWVQGERLSRSIVDVEDEFFDLYNEINKDRDYDIYCGYMSLSRGSMIMTRMCVPAFLTYFSTPTTFLTYADGYSHMSYSSVPSPPSGLVLMERREVYAKHVLDTINSDQQLLRKYMELIGMYEQMRQTQERYVAARKARGLDTTVPVKLGRFVGPRSR